MESAVTDELLGGVADPAWAVFDLAAGEREGSLAVLHALHSLTTRLAAEKPLLLSVDNLQWVDAPSLRYLAYLARRMGAMPAIVAASIRSGEADDIADLVTELAFDTDTVLIQPCSRCPRRGMNKLAERAYGCAVSPLFVAACHLNDERQSAAAPPTPARSGHCARREARCVAHPSGARGRVTRRLQSSPAAAATDARSLPPGRSEALRCWAMPRICRAWPSSPG